MTMHFMKKYFKKIAIFISLLAVLALPHFVLAESSASAGLKKVGEGTNAPYQAITDANSLAGIVGIVIQAFLGILGVLFLCYILYAGYNWMTAQGEEEKVTKAKDTLKRAIVGAIIIVAAYAISIFVMSGIEQGTLKGAGGGSPNIYQPGG